jgi:hypothetical protein
MTQSVKTQRGITMEDRPTFYSFRNGKKFSDIAINAWIEQCVEKVRQNKESFMLRSGDAMVVAFWHDDRILVTVSTSDGYSALNVFHEHDNQEIAKYKRGVTNT